MNTELQLPTQLIKADQINPKRLIIYSKPKTGKTTAYAGLENNLIIDTEDGSGYVNALKIKISSLEELAIAGEKIKAAGYPYKYVTIDTVTVLEDMCLTKALKLYKNTPMGASFKGDNVLKLPNGAGYMYLREAFFQVLDYIDKLAPHIILSGHLKDKQVDDNGQLVQAAAINLTGKIAGLICSKADAIGYMFRDGNKTILTFKAMDEITCGARPEHLKNKEIVLAEEINGEYKTYWDKIYK
jgi:hypothetical protein